VTANGNINVGSSRIATFNGGDVFVESYNGDVNAGNGANLTLHVIGYGGHQFGDDANLAGLIEHPTPYGSGILAELPTEEYVASGVTQPGNIKVLTPNGNIVSGQGGISQFALNGSISGGPTVTLIAGTPGVPASPTEGNIELGPGGVIGGTVNVTAQGIVQGLIVSRQDANVSSQEGFTGTVLSGGAANFSGGGSVSGTVVGIGGISVSGGGSVSATLLSANVSGVAGVENTLGTSVAASSTAQSAANQSDSSAKQELASDNTESDDEKKKKKKQPAIQHIKRVTVLLPKV
jgi:hypothetical protein